MVVSEVRVLVVEVEVEVVEAVVQATGAVVATIQEETVSRTWQQSSAKGQITDEEPRLRLQSNLTSTKVRMISPILVVLARRLVKGRPDLSHRPSRLHEPLSLSRSRKKSISLTLEMMSQLPPLL